MNIAILTAATIAIFAAGPAQTPPKYDMKVIELAFLRNPTTPLTDFHGVDPNKIRAEHLARFEDLWNKRIALFAGPFKQPAPYIGAALFDVDTKEKADAIMKEDPWVKAGILTYEIRPIFIARNVPQKGPKFMDMEPLWFGFLRSVKDRPKLPQKELEDIQAGHMANIVRMAGLGKLVIAGPFEENTDLRGIFIFRAKDKAEIEELVSHDPTIQKKRLTLDVYPWLTAKGTFPTPNQ